MCLEKLCSWHKNPINTVLHLIAFAVLIYGLWMNDWTWIIVAVIIAVAGHIIQAMQYPKSKIAIPKAKKRKSA